MKVASLAGDDFCELSRLAAAALSFMLIGLFGGKFHIELLGSLDGRFILKLSD